MIKIDIQKNKDIPYHLRHKNPKLPNSMDKHNKYGLSLIKNKRVKKSHFSKINQKTSKTISEEMSSHTQFSGAKIFEVHL